MNKREVGSLAFKLAGIYALIVAAPLVHGFVALHELLSDPSGFTRPDISIRILLAILWPLPFLLLVALGIFLIVRSDRLSVRMFGNLIEDAEPATSTSQIQAIAFSVLGVFMFVSALPRGLQVLYNLSLQFKDPALQKKLEISWWAHAIGLFLQAGVGICLFFGGKGLARFWHKLQTAGQPSSTGEEERET